MFDVILADPPIRMGKLGAIFLYLIDSNGCFVCTSHKKNRKGYPVFHYKKGPMHIHRYLYMMKYGEISKGAVIRHKCDNRECINLDHLEVGTCADNSRDMVERGRSTYGERNPRATRTEAQIKCIRSSTLNSYELSKQLNIPASSIRAIRNRSRWKHI